MAIKKCFKNLKRPHMSISTSKCWYLCCQCSKNSWLTFSQNCPSHTIHNIISVANKTIFLKMNLNGLKAKQIFQEGFSLGYACRCLGSCGFVLSARHELGTPVKITRWKPIRIRPPSQRLQVQYQTGKSTVSRNAEIWILLERHCDWKTS